MSISVRFTPLTGSHSSDEAPCYVLDIDDCKILLDCGWDIHFNSEQLAALACVAPEVDCVLLSQPDLKHLGALPYAFAKLGLDCPVYCTAPVKRNGQMFLYDAFQSRFHNDEFDVFSLDDVDHAFEQCVALKYSQHQQLRGNGEGITVTPFNAGHSIGGTMWRIKKEQEEIIYCIRYNHKKEMHLNAGVLATYSRPTLLITGARNALQMQRPRHVRDKELMSSVVETLRRNGNVLLPVDTAGRCLELLLLFETYWKANRLSAFPVAYVTNVAYNTIEFAKSQLEWLSDHARNRFESDRTNPYHFQAIHVRHTLAEIASLPRPLIVLCSSPELDFGLAREMFAHWAADEKNTILFTQRSDEGTLARRLIDNLSIKELDLTISRRVDLEGDELFAYRRQQEIARLQELEAQRLALAEQELLEIEENSDEEPEQMIVDAAIEKNPYFQGTHDLILNRNVKLTPYPMYPFTSSTELLAFGGGSGGGGAGEWSAYGEIINPNDYRPEEERLKMEEERRRAEAAAEAAKKAEEEAVQAPTKIRTYQVHIDVKATLKYIDFEGLSDGPSLKTVLEMVKARNLILVGGSPAALDELKSHCARTLKNHCKRIMSPDALQTVEATSETQLYQVRFEEGLLRTIHWETLDDYQIAWLDAKVSSVAREDDNTETRVLAAADQLTPHRTVYAGSPSLKEFRSVLQLNGIDAFFVQGMLVCNSVVRVKKAGETDEGKTIVKLEGAFCPDYFRIRDLLYTQFKVI